MKYLYSILFDYFCQILNGRSLHGLRLVGEMCERLARDDRKYKNKQIYVQNTHLRRTPH